MRSAKALAFDLEGTIIDLERLHHAAHIAAAADCGVHLTVGEAVERLPHFVGGPDEQVACEIAALGSPHLSISELLQRKQAYFDAALKREPLIKSRPGFAAFLTATRDAGLRCAIGSVTDMERARELILRTEIAQLLDGIPLVSRGDVLRPKPAPDVYVRTAHLCGVLVEDQLVFEDSPVGVRAAHAAGSRVLAVPTVQTDEMIARLEAEGAEVVCLSWDDVATCITFTSVGEAEQALAILQSRSRKRGPS